MDTAGPLASARPEGVAPFGRPIGPVLALMLLAPFMAEVLSGASSPLGLVVFPPLIALDLGLYGCGAVLIREAVLRWNRGWPGVLALGVAFAFVEEGLVVSSFFDPNSPPRRAFDSSGRWGAGPDGSNWVWIPVLCLFHAVVAIALPILVVQLAYPSRARATWLSGRRILVAAACLILAALLGRAMFSSGAFADGYYAHIEGWQVGASLAAIVGLVALARSLPARIGPQVGGRAPEPWLVAVLAAAAYAAYFLAGMGGESVGLPPAVALGAVLTIATVAALALTWASAGEGWSDRHRFAVPVGVGAFYVVVSPLLGPVGLLVGLGTAAVMWRGWRRLRTT